MIATETGPRGGGHQDDGHEEEIGDHYWVHATHSVHVVMTKSQRFDDSKQSSSKLQEGDA